MNYTTFNTTAFTHGITESLDQTVAQPSAWLIETLTSKEAQRKYAIAREVGQRLAEITRLVVLATIASINEYVEACEQSTIAPELPTQQEEQVEIEEITVKPAAARTMPKAATAVVVPEGKAIKDMTSRELRALCTEKGIRWNRASKIKHAAHMTSAEMRAALQG